MKKSFYNTVFILISVILVLMNFETSASESTSNVISSESKQIILDQWQIVKDEKPNQSLPPIPDSVWQIFNPTLDDERFNQG
ncbi:MAG: hypothetical protein WA440_14945, partial [Ignavibacteriaceae bacterium]